jgi:methyl-accepting chemotaxis protein
MADAANTSGSASRDYGKPASVPSTVDKALDTAKDFAQSTTAGAKDAVSSLASDVTDGFKKSVEDHKRSGAEAIASVARSARETAQGFQDQAPQLAGAISDTATAIEKMSNELKDRTVGEIVDSVSGFAQRRPLAFLGCGVLAGLVIARIMSPSRSS